MVLINDQVKIYLDILYRRRWWFVLPVVLSVIAGVVVFKKLPKIYRSATTILVVRQKVPVNVVRSTVTTRVEERMASLSVQILSRTYLESVVKEFGLVPENPTDRQVEGACKKLSAQVQIQYDSKRYSYFEIGVVDNDAERAAGIANRLAELFIEQNNELRQEEAARTLTQIGTWLAENGAELELVEQRIADFRRAHMWELPGNMNTNISLLNAAQQRIDTLTKDIQAQSQRLDALRAATPVSSAVDGGVGIVPVRDPVSAQLAAMRSELAGLLLDYTDQHPSVRRQRQKIADFVRLHPELAAPPEPGGEPAQVATTTVPVNPAIVQLEREIAALEVERAQQRGEIDRYQGRISRAPAREQEFASLTRDLSVLQNTHDSLLSKKEEAERAMDLEAAQRGEHFQVQDSARRPTRPFKPVAANIIGMFLFAGFGVGLGIVVLLELLDQTIRTEIEFRTSYPQIPLMVSMPNLAQAKPGFGAKSRLFRKGRN